MVAYASATRALSSAMDIQRAFAAYNREHLKQPINVRIGLNTGESIEGEGDYFASPSPWSPVSSTRPGAGRFWCPRSCAPWSARWPGWSSSDAGRKQLKSIKGRRRLYEVVW